LDDVDLPPLVGTNPLGFLAALGALDVAHRLGAPSGVSLRWTDEILPHAVLEVPCDSEELVRLCDADRQRWLGSALLSRTDEAGGRRDLKLRQSSLRAWAQQLAESVADRASADLLCALVAEGAVARNGAAKPTHLDFTAGQQRFLEMARHLASAVTAEDFREALFGPWRYQSTLPLFGWDSRGERIYALRAADPSNDVRTGVPGADWLAFLGLTFFPVVTSGTSLLTTGCSRAWKDGQFRWPMWSPPIGARTVRSLLRDPRLWTFSAEASRARGIIAVLEAPIRRSQQGGYGSFGPATKAVERRPSRGRQRACR
jgi:hypothetical protein